MLSVMSVKPTPTARRRKAFVDRVLVYLDGPQLITLVGSRNSNWIGVAVDIDGLEYPFFCSQVSSDDLQKYFDGHVDLHYLFAYSKYKDFMVFDYCKYNGTEIYMDPIEPTDDFLPEKGFFSRDHTEVVSNGGHSISPSATSSDSYIVDIDGNWEFPELSTFSEKMSSVYSFLHAVHTLSQIPKKPVGIKASRLEETFSAHPWQGGFSYVNFYNDLYMSIPKIDRLNVREIAYASPGHISLEGNKVTFSDVRFALSAMNNNGNRPQEYYSNLYQYLSQSKLLSASVETIRGSSSVQGIIEGQIRALANVVSLEYLDTIYQFSENNWIITAKIILSYYRRLAKLFQFYAEGRAK